MISLLNLSNLCSNSYLVLHAAYLLEKRSWSVVLSYYLLIGLITPYKEIHYIPLFVWPKLVRVDHVIPSMDPASKG